MLDANPRSVQHDLRAFTVLDLKPIWTTKRHQAKESFACRFDLQACDAHAIRTPAQHLSNSPSPSSVPIRIGKITAKLNPQIMRALNSLGDHAHTPFIPVLVCQNLDRISCRELPAMLRRPRIIEENNGTDNQHEEKK